MNLRVHPRQRWRYQLPLVLALVAAVSAETWTEDSIDVTLDPSGGTIVSKAWTWDIHGSGYLNFAELEFDTTDNDEDKDRTVDAAIFFLSHPPDEDDLADWQNKYLGATTSDGSTRYCCTKTSSAEYLCDEDRIGELIVKNDAETVLRVEHHTIGTAMETIGMTGVVSVAETEHLVLVFGYCNDDTETGSSIPPVRIHGPLIGVSYVSGNTLPLYGAFAVIVTGLVVWYHGLMAKHADSRIRVEEWILKVLVLSAAGQVLEFINIAAEVYTNTEPLFLEFFSDVVGSVASAASRCLYLVLGMGLGVVTSGLSRTTNSMLALCLGGYVVGLCAIDAMDLVERGPIIARFEQFVLVLDVVFLVWIPCALCRTMAYLRANGEVLKLVRYRWILRIYGLAILLSVLQVGLFFYDMIKHGGRNYDLESLREGNEFIHVVVLVCIAYLWRPNPSQQQYAYALLEENYEDDECGDDTNTAHTTGITDLELTEMTTTTTTGNNNEDEVVIEEGDSMPRQPAFG